MTNWLSRGWPCDTVNLWVTASDHVIAQVAITLELITSMSQSACIYKCYRQYSAVCVDENNMLAVGNHLSWGDDSTGWLNQLPPVLCVSFDLVTTERQNCLTEERCMGCDVASSAHTVYWLVLVNFIQVQLVVSEVLSLVFPLLWFIHSFMDLFIQIHTDYTLLPYLPCNEISLDI